MWLCSVVLVWLLWLLICLWALWWLAVVIAFELQLTKQGMSQVQDGLAGKPQQLNHQSSAFLLGFFCQVTRCSSSTPVRT
jgi:hypothetical protein